MFPKCTLCRCVLVIGCDDNFLQLQIYFYYTRDKSFPRDQMIGNHAMEVYGGVEVYVAPLFMTSALDGREWSASHLCSFTTVEPAVPIE
jgi:hypothetical protein